MQHRTNSLIGLLSLIFTFLQLNLAYAQLPPMQTPPPGGNKKAWIGERIGITDVEIHYDRPGVKGREGKIYSTLVVHKGYRNLSEEYGTATEAPWRAGANENTTMEFSTAVKIEGKELPAGKYGFFIAYDPNECTLIFSKNNQSWGSYFYDNKEDALRVNVKPAQLEKSVEWLKYEFINQTENSANIALQWEHTQIAFKVEVDLVQTQLDNFRSELRGSKGFSWESWEQAAFFCLEQNINFKEALTWSNNAVSFNKNFQTMSTKAGLLEKLNRPVEADSLMKAAVSLGTMNDLHQYGKRLIALKKNKEALEIFTLNATKNPKQYTTYMGLMRGYSAKGDYKTALTHAKSALAVAPDAFNKNYVAEMIKKLESGKDVN